MNVLVGGRRYSPSRDIVYAWPQYLIAAAESFTGAWTDSAFNAVGGVKPEDVGAVFEALKKFPEMARSPMCETLEMATIYCGLYETDPQARLAVIYQIGLAAIGGYYLGVGEVSFEGDVPPVSDRDVRAAAARMIEAMRPSLGLRGRLRRGLAWLLVRI